jgi:prepilin-type N-terminal cleavage/methylation domain-containing protein
MLKNYGQVSDFINISTQPAVRRSLAASFGFTIVELLIVIVVIGVLAAIVIVAYTGVTNSAKVSSVKTDLAGMAKKLEVYKATNGTYPRDATALENVGMVANQSIYDIRNNLYYIGDNAGRWYAIGAIVSNVAYCLETGWTRVNGGSNCNSYANTQTNVRNQATAAGVDGATITLFGGVGFDDPADGAGSGWATWMQ